MEASSTTRNTVLARSSLPSHSTTSCNYPTETESEMMASPRVTSSYSYTSLRDIMSHSSSIPNTASWNEIPIKNPLLKHAALAYLQPMSTPSDDFGDRSFLHRFKNGCFGWLSCAAFDALFSAFLGFFCGSKRIANHEEEEEEEEEEHRHHEQEDDDDDEEEEDEDDNVDRERGG